MLSTFLSIFSISFLYEYIESPNCFCFCFRSFIFVSNCSNLYFKTSLLSFTGVNTFTNKNKTKGKNDNDALLDEVDKTSFRSSTCYETSDTEDNSHSSQLFLEDDDEKNNKKMKMLAFGH